VRSRTLALLLGIDFRKLSARHKHNRTSRDFKKHFYLMHFYDCDFFAARFVMSAVLICKWTLSHYDDDDDDDDDLALR